MHNFKTLLLVCCFFFGIGAVRAQSGLGQEVGIVAGPVAFFSDYGIRYNLETNTGNTGYGIGLVYYWNFTFGDNCGFHFVDRYFNDHFRVRAELNYISGELRHFGEVAESPGPRGDMLRAMMGSSKITEFGAHLEYFPLSIKDFTAWAYPVSPFISLGANLVYFQPHTTSTLGPLEDNLIREFQVGTGEFGGVSQESGTTWSIVLGAGARYRLIEAGDLVFNAQWKYYHTDWLEGLNHDNPQNKSKDFLFWLNIGYIHYLNF